MSTSLIGSRSGSVRRARLGSVFAIALLAVPSTAGAQDPNLVDQGRFDISIGDRVAGTETFAIRRQGEGYMAVGRMQLEREDGWLRSAEFGLRTNGAFVPVSFQHEALGRPRRSLILTRTGTRLRITISNNEGDRMTELLANPNQVLLGPGIAQHYFFIVRRIEAAGDRNAGLVAILPGERSEQPVAVESVTEVDVMVGGTARGARRYELDVGGTEHLVWADPSDGRILKVEIPDRGWTSIRRASN